MRHGDSLIGIVFAVIVVPASGCAQGRATRRAATWQPRGRRRRPRRWRRHSGDGLWTHCVRRQWEPGFRRTAWRRIPRRGRCDEARRPRVARRREAGRLRSPRRGRRHGRRRCRRGHPDDVRQADYGVGCCADGVNYYCDQSGQGYADPCTGSKVCGWHPKGGGYYACVDPPGGSDPSGTYPIACE